MTARHLLNEIACVVRCEDMQASERLAKVEQLLSDYESLQGAQEQDNLQRYEQLLDQHTDVQRTCDGLEKQSVSLQRKVSSILKALVFDTPSSEGPVLDAVVHFQVTDGNVGQSPPLDFLSKNVQKYKSTKVQKYKSTKVQALFTEGEVLRTSLYKILLFQAAAGAVRAGK